MVLDTYNAVICFLNFTVPNSSNANAVIKCVQNLSSSRHSSMTVLMIANLVQCNESHETSVAVVLEIVETRFRNKMRHVFLIYLGYFVTYDSVLFS